MKTKIYLIPATISDRKDVSMITNFMKIAFRQAWRYKEYTFINIIGLAISFACCLLIFLWLINQWSYDNHHPDYQSIHAIQAEEGNLSTPNALASFLEEQVPGVLKAGRVTGDLEVLISSASLNSFEEILPADPAVIDIFSFPFISGNPRTALSDPNSTIITEKMAAKFFPGRNALGQTLTIDQKRDFTVTGVIEDIPRNSVLRFDIMVPMDYIRQPFVDDGFDFNSWRFWGSNTYVKTQPGVTAPELTKKISVMINDRYEDEEVTLTAFNIGDVYMRLMAPRREMNIFLAVAIAILLTACINFINLSTAGYKTRIKEIGIRKTVGAGRTNLIVQFMGESMLLIIFGFVSALILAECTLPFFNSLFHTRLSLELLKSFRVMAAAAGIIILTGFTAGFYPSLFLSRFRPVQIIKEETGRIRGRLNLRRILVVFQFALSAIIIIGSVTVYNQVRYLKTRDVGYNKEQVINIQLRGESGDKYAAIKNELVRDPGILAVTAATRVLPYWSLSTTASWLAMEQGQEEDVYFNFVDYDFVKTFGIEMLEGRDFDKNHVADNPGGCVINESLAHKMNQDQILGSGINIWGEDRSVIGVMKDFNFQPLNYPIEPIAFILIPEEKSLLSSINYMSIRVSPDNLQTTLGYIENVWNQIVPGHPFEFTFLDESFDAEYASMEMLQNLTGGFGVLAIIIACLGIFGIASFSAGQRTKEMGIRKVLGASVTGIVSLISREYIILVGIANLIAWPVAWFMMDRWLSEFAYRVDVGIGTLLIIGIFSALVALLTIGYKTLQVARANPVIALRNE
jgi:ABC-type antimicrobial peptide transport system permease subunit